MIIFYYVIRSGTPLGKEYYGKTVSYATCHSPRGLIKSHCSQGVSYFLTLCGRGIKIFWPRGRS